MLKIVEIKSNKYLNSRANWTIKTTVTLSDGSIGEQTVPNGASKGEKEALNVSADIAIENVQGKIFNALKDVDPQKQGDIDKKMIELDGTENKSNLGGNSMLSVSLAVARAVAISQGVPLYEYLAGLYGNKLEQITFPTPVFNIFNGGQHASNGLSFQEFMVIPAQNMPFDKAVQVGVDAYQALKAELKKCEFSVSVGDEGGFAPQGFTVKRALTFIKTAVSSQYELGKNVFLGMDVAAGSFYEDNRYKIGEENLELTAEELSNYYGSLLKDFPIMYLEDAFYENDLVAWENFTSAYGERTMVVGDDLVVTNPVILDKAIEQKLCNAVIVKPNQIGTLSETLEFVKKAKEAGFATCISHRSGDTAEDTFISDLAVAVGSEFLKSGAPARGERVVKYNRLLEIFYSLEN